MADSSGRITLWGIEVFAATAEEGSVSAAARRLRSSPSTVSQQLTALETALGAELMDRSTRPVQLTPAGVTFRKRVEVILSEAAQAKAELAGQDLQHLTRLRLGVIEDFDAAVTPQLLQDMSQDLQTCQFLLETGASHRLFDQLDSRALDVIVATEMGPPADWMEIHPLLEEPFVVAAPMGTLEQGNPAEILPQMPLIQYTQRHHMGRMLNDHLARQRLKLNHRFELDSYHAIMAMVASGAGWTILTPLGLMHAQRFRNEVEMLPSPFAPLSRRISLHTRGEVLQDLPHDIAARLRDLLSGMVVKPAVARMPWLGDSLRIL